MLCLPCLLGLDMVLQLQVQVGLLWLGLWCPDVCLDAPGAVSLSLGVKRARIQATRTEDVAMLVVVAVLLAVMLVVLHLDFKQFLVVVFLPVLWGVGVVGVGVEMPGLPGVAELARQLSESQDG